MSVRAADPDTSLEAWVSLHPHLPKEKAAVLVAIELAGPAGCTAEDIVDHLALRGIHRQRNCVSSRCSELQRLGLIEDRGHRRKSATTRKSQIVFHRVWAS